MGDLVLGGRLDFSGNLDLAADGGKVTISGLEVLVELAPGAGPHGNAVVPVILPPPPGAPLDAGPVVTVINSFSKTVKIGGKPIVAQGMTMQGSGPTWPGMVLPSQGNTGPVTCNGLPVNVQTDQAVTFPTGAPTVLSTSGQ